MFKPGDKVKRRAEYTKNSLFKLGTIYTVEEYLSYRDTIILTEDVGGWGKDWDGFRFELALGKSKPISEWM